MVLDAKETYNNLLKKGFREATYKSNDHKWVVFWHGDKLTRIRTKISHSAKDLDDYLINQMSKQTSLTKKDFIRFAECTMTEEEYVKVLAQRNFL